LFGRASGAQRSWVSLRYSGRNSLGLIAFCFFPPAFTIGLASFIAVLEGLNLVRGLQSPFSHFAFHH
jgi:hypothetical protein